MNILREIIWMILGINELELEIKMVKWDMEAMLFVIAELYPTITHDQMDEIRVKWGKLHPLPIEKNIRVLESLHKRIPKYMRHK